MVSRELNKRVCPTVDPHWHPLKCINLSRPLHCHPSTMVSLFCLPLWSLTIWFKCLLLPCPIIKDTELSVFFSLICILWPSWAGNVRLGIRAVFQAWFRLSTQTPFFLNVTMRWREFLQAFSFSGFPVESGNVSSNLVFDHFLGDSNVIQCLLAPRSLLGTDEIVVWVILPAWKEGICLSYSSEYKS